MRSKVTRRKLTEEEYGDVLAELTKKREHDATEALRASEATTQKQAEEIMSKIDMPALLAAAGIIPHSGCAATIESMELEDTAAPIEDALVTTTMHNSSKFRLRCKQCGKQFIIA